MLIKSKRFVARPKSMRRQSGVVMLVALIVLVVMTLAGLALMRSMDTTNLIAGNMAFKQSATQAADVAVEAAIGWLEANSKSGILDNDQGLFGYKSSAVVANSDPMYQQVGSLNGFWNRMSASGVCYLPISNGGVTCSNQGAYVDPAGNSYGFMIQRLCAIANTSKLNAQCPVVTGITTVSTGNNEDEDAKRKSLTAISIGVFYRITVQVLGPRNTVSYVQAIISM
jgi:type IV pilus assembly protein PilX